MSRMFNTIKRYYEDGTYTKANLRTFVKAKAITKDEYKLITGEDY